MDLATFKRLYEESIPPKDTVEACGDAWYLDLFSLLQLI